MSFNDMAITAKVKASFASDDVLSAEDINIDTHNGVVVLKGNVADLDEKNRAEQIAQKTSGVKDVLNELKVGS